MLLMNVASMLAVFDNSWKCLDRCTSLRLLQQIHAQVFINGLSHDNYVAVKLISFCSKTLGDTGYARLIFKNLITTANVFLWTAIITSYSNCQSEISREAVRIYKVMHQEGIAPNHFTLSSLLKSCSYLKAIKEGNQIHAHSAKLGYNSSVYIQASLLDMYAKNGRIQEATQLYHNFPNNNVVLCNTMMTCYAKASNMKAAREVFDTMSDRDSISWNVMVSAYADCGNVLAARELFDQMPEREINSCNALMAGYSRNGKWHEARELFKEMCLGSVKPNHVSMAVLMSACGNLGSPKIARQLHGLLEKRCIEMNCFVSNSLVDLYAKCGDVDEAYRIFCEMSIKDVVSYNVMIVGFASHGHSKEAMKLLPEMLDRGFSPDTVTFLGLLTACSHAGLLNLGRSYFDCMSSVYAIEPSADHYACIVDLYGRAGLVKDAYDLVRNMSTKPHAGVWGALLNACRKYSHIEIGKIAAQELFRVEPENPGNYVLLSNMYAKDYSWDGVADVRRLMRRRGVLKTAGCSWIEIDGVINEFLTEDASHPCCKSICTILHHLSMLSVA